MEPTPFAAAAWVPDDDEHRDWEDAASYAIEWIEQQARVDGGSIVLVTNALDTVDAGLPGLRAFASRH